MYLCRKSDMKDGIVSGIIGASIMILIIVIVMAFIAPIDYAPVYLLNPEKALESKGVLLNPGEYTSHIAEYYNTLISFLLGLFAIFTFGTIYSIKTASKKEIDEIKTDINNHKEKINTELKKSIVESLSELMKDSISFKDTCINALYGRIEDEVLRHEDKEVIDNRMLKLEEDVKLLFEAYNELEEDKSSNQEIE